MVYLHKLFEEIIELYNPKDFYFYIVD